MGVWGATPKPKQFFWHCAVQTPPSQVSKNTVAGLSGTEVWVVGAPPQNPNKFSGIVQFKHPHHWYPKTCLIATRGQRYGFLGRHPRTQTIFFGIVQFRHPHYRYPKTSLLATRGRGYGCLERHPKTQTIFLALCSSNNPIPGIRKHFCWSMG